MAPKFAILRLIFRIVLPVGGIDIRGAQPRQSHGGSTRWSRIVILPNTFRHTRVSFGGQAVFAHFVGRMYAVTVSGGVIIWGTFIGDYPSGPR